jgi:glycosyltransferase involved in cell wall biosynthesis
MVLLSDFETHPISALEALALNRPVLLADNSGMRELAERGWARVIPADSSPSEVADAALQQIRDPILPQKMDWFSWDDCAQALLKLYREVLANDIAKN